MATCSPGAGLPYLLRLITGSVGGGRAKAGKGNRIEGSQALSATLSFIIPYASVEETE